jgi:ABC-type polysaccharide/polyol phosphate transport system ATPase subunit
MNEPAIRVKNVAKSFRLSETRGSLGALWTEGLRKTWMRRRDRSSGFTAVDGVTFDVASGESLGIIGPNGAGKSTVLRMLAGILRPTRGLISVRGRLTALIEVGAGFHPDLTGRENVFLHGAILGMSRAEIRRKLDAIVDFAGIGRFLDVPVKRYSSGMYARLGFSIAAHVDPDVLLVDEVLSVGDALFRLRCLERMRELLRGGTALIFVTHNLEQVQAVCTRALVLDAGRVAFDGEARKAVRDYVTAISHSQVARATDLEPCATMDSIPMEEIEVDVQDTTGRAVETVQPDRPLRVQVRVRSPIGWNRLVVELNLRAATGERIASFNTGRDGVPVSFRSGENRLTVELPFMPVGAGHYFWNVRIWDAERGVALVDTPLKFPLYVEQTVGTTGLLALPHRWSFTEPRGDEHAATPATDPSEPMDREHEDLLLC